MKSDRELLESIDARLSRMEALHSELLVMKPTQKELAQRMGVHRTTLWKRRQRARINQVLEAAGANQGRNQP